MYRLLLLTFFILLIAACGGGGNTPSNSNNTNNSNDNTVAPDAASLSLLATPTKSIQFSWNDVEHADSYKLFENPDGVSGYVQVGDDIAVGVETYSHIIALHDRLNASYILQSCNANSCTDSNSVNLTDSIVNSAVGKLNAFNADNGDAFGYAISLSADGKTLAVGAPDESSNGIDPNNDSVDESGAVYIFTRNTNGWIQQSMLKASEVLPLAGFGISVSLNAAGDTLAVGAFLEDYDTDEYFYIEEQRAGAVYIFTNHSGQWQQSAKLIANNIDGFDEFGGSVSLNAAGTLVAIGAIREDGSSRGVNNPVDENAVDSGAVYLFAIVNGSWQQIAIIKSPSPAASDFFGSSLALSNDGTTVVVGAINVKKDPYFGAGAAYVYRYSNNAWAFEAELIPNNIGSSHNFGYSVAINNNGSIIAVGAIGEASDSTGITTTTNNNAIGAGAAYVFNRDLASGWQQAAFVKAPNAEGRANSSPDGDQFGYAVALTADGHRLIVSAIHEDSDSAGLAAIDNNLLADSGAVYIYDLVNDAWQFNQMIKANDTFANAEFGSSLSISADGSTISAGSIEPTLTESGSVYLY